VVVVAIGLFLLLILVLQNPASVSVHFLTIFGSPFDAQ